MPLQRKYRGVVREMSAARVVAGALEQGECSGGEDNSETEDAAVNNHEGNVSRAQGGRSRLGTLSPTALLHRVESQTLSCLCFPPPG